jgi:hypothetical protein
VPGCEIAVTTGMNKATRFITTTASICALALLTGCFETHDEFTINPDGSGKVIHQCTFPGLSTGDRDVERAVRKVISEAKGVEAWRDMSFKVLGDDRIFFKGTAYFTNMNVVEFPDQSMLEFDWQRSGANGTLTLRKNKIGKEDNSKPETKLVNFSKLTPKERAERLKKEREDLQQSKPLMVMVLENLKQEAIFHLPGKVTESFNFSTGTNGSLRLQFEGTKFIAAMETFATNDEWAVRNINPFISDSKGFNPTDEINAVLFGSNAPIRAVVSLDQPLFDYATEVTAAKKEMAQVFKNLDGDITTIAPPSPGGPLKGVSVVGVRLVSDLGPEISNLRPFNYPPGYTVVLKADFPGSILRVTESRFDTAVADDGSNLLSSPRRKQSNSTDLSPDRTSTLIEFEMDRPGPQVKGLKELSGGLQYCVADTSKEVDLGFKRLKPGAKGTQLGAVIKSIGRGWKKNGCQQMELTLNLNRDRIKTIHLTNNGVKARLEPTSYSSSDDDCTLTLESDTAFPASGKLTVEIYDQLKAFEATFKVENISLLGTPLEKK